MKQNKIPRNEYIRKPVGKTNPYKHDVDYVSAMGYRDDSPFNDRPYIDIHTPSGMIDMSNTGIPLMANGMYLPPYSGMYNMGTPYVREQKIPMAQNGRIQVEDNDSWLENIAESVDPTGISSWDDVYRAYQNTGLSGETALEALGAIPFLGKIGKSGKVITGGFGLLQDAVKASKYLPASKQQKFIDKAFDMYQKYNKAGGKELDEALGATTKVLRDKIPYINPSKWSSSDKAINIANKSFKAGKLSDAVQAALGSKDNSGFTWDMRHGEVPKYGGRNIFPQIDLGEHGDFAYGGDPSLANIEGHYPFGGQNSKTGTHFEEGGWLDQYQTRGEVKPIYVTDPNDPRLKAYGDSLGLYNDSQFNWSQAKKYASNISNDGRVTFNNQLVNTIPDIRQLKNINEKNKPESWRHTTSDVINKNTKGYDSNRAFPLFKKPVQPYVYEEPIKEQSKKAEPKKAEAKKDYATRNVDFSSPYGPVMKYYDESGKVIRTEPYTPQKQEGGWLDELDEEYRRGGQRRRRGTSKNIESSINDIFRRNYDVFGPAGKSRFNPRARYEEGGGLDQYQGAGQIKISDKRKIRKTTGKDINPNKDLKTGLYNKAVIDSIAENATRRGINPYQAVAMGLVESGLGKTDRNIGHVAMYDSTVSPYTQMMDNIVKSQAVAKRLNKTTPEEIIQAYNGYGKLFPTTEQDYHGFKTKSFYGVPIDEKGISLKENPLYGKEVLDIQKNVIEKNPAIKNIVTSYQYPRQGRPHIYTDYAKNWDEFMPKFPTNQLREPTEEDWEETDMKDPRKKMGGWLDKYNNF